MTKEFTVLLALLIVALIFVYRSGLTIIFTVFLVFATIIGGAMTLFDGLPSGNSMREQITAANIMAIQMDTMRGEGSDNYRQASLSVNNTTDFALHKIVVECTGVTASGREQTLRAYTHSSVAARQSKTIVLDFAADVFEDGDFSSDRCKVIYEPEAASERREGMWSQS